ncbi:hypothetical protein ES705_34839 [subsurface metagenome]
MKKSLCLLCVVVVVSGLCSSSAQALTPIGPPVATLDRGQFAAGFGYSHSSFDLKVSALGITVIAEDQELDTYMANLCFGLDDAVELQIDLGANRYDDDDGNTSDDFAGGFGVKTTFAKQDKLEFGAAFMMHWYEASPSGEYLGIPWSEENEWTEIQVAIGPCYKDGPWCLYGGPFLHFIDGEGDANVGGFEFSGDFEEDSNFGGFVGFQVDLDDNTTFGFEYQQTGSANGLGANIRFKF